MHAVRSGYDAEQRESTRSQSQEDRVRGQAGPSPGLLLGLPAAHLPGGRQGQERDRREPVRDAEPRYRPDRRRAESPAAGPRRRGGHHPPVPAARARRRRPRHGPRAGPARPAGPREGRARDLALALVISTVIAPAPEAKMALYDLSSSWLEGSQCPLAARGYSRDGNKCTLPIEYALFTNPAAP